MRHAEFQPLSGRHVLFARRSSRQALAQRYVRRGQRCRQRRTRRSIVLAAWDRLAHSQKAIQPEGRLRPLPDGEIVFGGEVSWCAPRCLEDRNSVCLDARELHHLAPLLDLVTNELSEVSGGAPKCRDAHVGKTRDDLWIGEKGIDLQIKLFNNVGRRVSGRANSRLPAVFVARHELPDGRYVWQDLRARGGRHGQCAQATGADVLQDLREGAEHYLHLSAH
jgi:hypothetical protein